MPNLSLAQPDVALLLDLEGVIREATFSSALDEEAPSSWVGRSWAETVASDGHSVERMVDDARRVGVSGFRLIAQRLPSGRELPIEYATVRLGGTAGLMAVGKNMAAVAEVRTELVANQKTMERDFWKLRDVETRYRLLFETAGEPALVVRPDDLQVVEANAAAMETLSGHIVGRNILDNVAAGDRHLVTSMLARAREHGRAPGTVIRLGPARAPWLARAVKTSVEAGSVLLVQLTPADGLVSALGEHPPVAELLERMPDALVVVDALGLIIDANRAFLDLAELPAKSSILGQQIGRWLGRPGADLAVVLDVLRRHGVVRRLRTGLSGELGGEAEIELSAVGDSDSRPRFVAILMRDVGRQLGRDEASAQAALSDAISALVQQVGETPLLELVKSTVEEVERHYVSAALQQTRGNRTAAAELLGLSRQSLYAKLWRYGLDGSGEATPN
jgi:transcriptional regulator PpsR